MKIKTLQIHKCSVSGFSDIQDKYCYSEEKGVIAISDGATQGFKSEIWAEMLVNNFVQNPEFEIEKFLIDLEKYAQDFSEIEFEPNPNPALRMLELRKIADGSYATFMGIEVRKDTLRYVSSGDVCGFVKTTDGLQSFPFSNVEELDKDKGFLSTTRLLNHQVKQEQFRSGKLSIKENDKIISEWEAKRLEEDDITICVIEPNAKSEEQNIHPPKDFSFPKVETPIINFNNDFKDKNKEEKQQYERDIIVSDLQKKHKVSKKILGYATIILVLFILGIGYLLYSGKIQKRINIKEKAFIEKPQVKLEKNIDTIKTDTK